MKQMRRLDCIWGMVAVCVLVLLVSWGCSGGGGSSSSTAAKSEGSYGKVGILLTDGPADEYEHIWVTITEVSLIPEGCDDAVVIFSSDEGYKFDLLAYRDKDFLLKLNESVPVGKYEKVRLKILKVEAEGGPCCDMDIKVPSGKIDLNPRGCIEVRENNTMYIRLDIDANKSINLHPAGNSGKCIFRPVVFVDIVAKEALPECPSFIKGEVSALDDTDNDGAPESFTIVREHSCLGSIDVRMCDDTLVFKEDGSFGCASDIQVGQVVTVRGMMDDGCIKASLVIIGDALNLCGTVQEPLSNEGFTLEPSSGQEMIGTVDVVLDEKTPIISGCNTPVDALEADMHVLVLGKYDIEAEKFFAAIVLVLNDEYSGTTSTVEKVEGGYYLTIVLEEGRTEKVFISSCTRIIIEGDGLFPAEMIPLLGLHPYHVKVIQGYDASIELRITPDSVKGKVEEISCLIEKILLVNDESLGRDVKVRITPLAIGIDTTGEADCSISFDDIDEGDGITCFGFWKGSGDDEEFLAFIYMVDDKEIEAD